jgi:GT2 family glycosyltransferase
MTVAGSEGSAADSGRRDVRIATVTITRDRAAELACSLERLHALQERPQVIVVDNASRDETLAVVRERFAATTLIALEHNLGAAARNVGVQAAKSPYVAFSDDDSWWSDGALRRGADLLDANPRLALVAARILVGPAQALDPTCAVMAESPLGPVPGVRGRAVLGFLACGAIVRRSAFEAVGGFRPRDGVGGEEQLLAVDLADAGHHVAYVPAVTAHHHPAQRGGDAGARRCQLIRNDLWFAWLRRSLTRALAQTGSLAAAALSDVQARTALVAAFRGAPRILADRRPVSRSLERDLRLLERGSAPPLWERTPP